MKQKLRIVFNIVIFVLVLAGFIIMMRTAANATGLTDQGLKNLKYYTVLSNIFAGIVAFAALIAGLFGKKLHPVWKLASAAAVALTFAVVAFFFGPLYGWERFYHGSNLFFHLIVPVICAFDYIFLAEAEKISVKWCMIASLSTVVYGSAYLINLLVNGVGEWPDSNDWYGFVNWGLGPGIVIFLVIILATFGIACLYRKLNRMAGRKGGSK